MKKTIIIFIAIMALTGCDAVNAIINYFVDIEVNSTTGTVNTDFTFKANTNDIVTSWVIDGMAIPTIVARSAEADEMTYNFSSGNHTVAVLTENGAEDEVEIVVSPVETVFSISAVTRSVTTELYLDYPILTIDGTDYNVETTSDLNISVTEELNTVHLQITVDNEDSFVFINNNAMNLYGIDLSAITVSQMDELFLLWYPERIPEPEIPFYSETRFNLSGTMTGTSDNLIVYDDKIDIGSETIIYSDNAVYDNDIRYICFTMHIDNSDSFLFINGNMLNFFGIDLSDMSYDELVIAADILNRYPSEGILELKEVYNP